MLLVASLAFAVWLTDVLEPWAFYSLPSRVWQLALGGLLAVGAGVRAAAARLAGRPGQLARTRGARGGLRADRSGERLPGHLGDPAGRRGGGPDPRRWPRPGHGRPPRLATAPVRRADLLLALPVALADPGPARRWPSASRCPWRPDWVWAALSIVVGAASWRFIEEPFWHGSLSTFRPRPVLATAVATAIAVAVLAVGIGEGSLAQVRAAGAAPGTGVAQTSATAAPAASPAGADHADSGGGGHRGKRLGCPNARDDGLTLARDVVGTGRTVTRRDRRPGNHWPSRAPSRSRIRGRSRPDSSHRWSSARDDKERLIGDGCFGSLKGSDPKSCTFGDPNGTFTVALVGDSHASHWFPAVERIADANGWRLITFVKASCVFVDLPIFSPLLKREYTECEAWRPLVVERLIAEQPDLVIVSSDRWLPPVNTIDADPVRQGEALARLLRQIPGRIAILADTPCRGRRRPGLPVRPPRRHHPVRDVATGRVRATAPDPRTNGSAGGKRNPGRPVGCGLPRRSVPAGRPRDDRLSRRPSPDGDVRRVAGRSTSRRRCRSRAEWPRLGLRCGARHGRGMMRVAAGSSIRRARLRRGPGTPASQRIRDQRSEGPATSGG